MERKLEHVELTVANTPGVLDRVVGHIRQEGWNIKRLVVDEAPDAALISNMEIDIEGTHTKLAQVMERLLNIDAVLSIAMEQNGQRVEKRRPQKETEKAASEETTIVSAPEKPPKALRVLAINPGSTSTKFALYDDETLILQKAIRHNRGALTALGNILAQKEHRTKCILDAMEAAQVPLQSLDAVVGRGGLLKPMESGTYPINEAMLRDLRSATGAIHASALGAIIAKDIADILGIPSYVVDPVVVDEMDRNAKLTGMPGIERSSVFHALNQKAIARRLAATLGRPYESCRFVVAHLGGGITIGAHRYGRVIDVNDALSGEGAFTPERTGGIPVVPIIHMCFSGEYTLQEMLDKVMKSGGMLAYLGTNDLRDVQKMINNGDEFAALVLDSMAYQVSKEIGAMVASLEGRVDAILLTGGLAHSTRFTGAIKQRVDRLAPVHVFPGEDEMLALLSGALRVLRGQEAPAEYE